MRVESSSFPVDVIKTHVRPRTSRAQHGNLDIKMCFSIMRMGVTRNAERA